MSDILARQLEKSVVLTMPDDQIVKEDDYHYRLGEVTVGVVLRNFVCNTCPFPYNFSRGTDKGCHHIQRLARYIKEHSNARS